MKTKIIRLSVILIVIYFTSCHQKEDIIKQSKSKENIVALVNDSLITIQELDNSIQQELFDELF